MAGLKLNIVGDIARNAQGFAPRMKGELSALNLVLPLDANSKIAFQNTRASFQAVPNLLQITRFEMFEGEESKVTGHALLRRTQGNRFSLNGQLLAEKFDAARLQKLLQNLQGSPTEAPQLAGVLYARADFSGRYFADGSAANPLILDEVGVQARLYRGRMIAFNTIVPIDVARLSTTLQFPLRGAIPIDQLLVWSGGSRIGVNGVLTPARTESGTSVYALDLDASVNTLRVRTLRNISAFRPAYQKIEAGGDLDGLISGQLHLSGTTSEPKIEGRAALKLAQAYGLDIEEAGANVSLETSANSSGAPSFRVALKEISGRIEGSRFSGNLDADSEANLWNLSLQTDDKISTNRLLHLAQTRDAAEAETEFIEFAGPSKPTISVLSNLPLRGEVGAVLNLSGTLKNEAGSTRVVPREGTVLLETNTLRWRGRDLGALNADLRLQNGVLQARQFELKHQLPDTKSNALLRVSGVLPVSLDTPDLDATVTIENEELSFVLEVLQEINRSLSDNGQKVVYLDSVLKRLKDLPSTLEGRFDMQAQLEQSWRVPVVEVRSLRAREVSFRNASGIQQRLPDVTARFIYDGNDNGAVAIQSAELRLPADARKANAGMTPEAIAAQNADGENGAENSINDNDLLIRTLRPGRIVPGGEISLAAEIINADLQKLAEWIPALRDDSGEAALKGQLSDFVLQVAGTTGDPTVTGSLQGENWQYGQYSLDRVRLDRFSIGDGKLQVEPGFLTVVKGDFQSDAAWGNLPWTWGNTEEAPGVSLTGPLDVHLPIDKENFGALAGIFVPQIINVGADAFSGEVTIGGTLNKPQLAGQAQITNGTFRVRSAVAELDAGVANISGAMQIVNGNQLQISGDGLTGKLVTADEVKAPETGNPVTDKRKASDARRKQKSPPPTLAGDFRILGSVAFDLEPRLWREPRRAMSSHRYDLNMSLVKGRYATPNFSGVRDVNLAAAWKTGAGEARNSQEFKYALVGVGDNNKKAAGQIVSSASFQLSPEFAVSANEFLRAKARTFFAGDSFQAIPVAAEGNSAAPSTPVAPFVPAVLTDVLREAEGKPSRAVLRDFRFDWKNVARGFLGGELNFDNRAAAIPPAPPFSTPRSRPRFYETALQTIASRGGSTPALKNVQGDVDTNNNDADNANFQTPLRVAGKITLMDAELFGAPPTREISDESLDDSGDATGPVIGVLSRFPDAPRFDVDFEAGRNVQFVSSNLRATITGILDLGGTPRDPILFGTVFTKSGSITFPNARARLETGEITITARRDPVADVLRTRVEVDATARGRSGRYDFTIRLRGPLDTGEASTQDLRVDITSNPALSTDEAFAQLLGTAAFNRGGTEGRDQEPYVRALVGVLSGPLFSGLERSLERTLGLTNIELNYSIDEAIGIEVGKAVGERLYISYRRALSSPSGQKTPFNLRLEYRIKGDLQLGIETDETQTQRFTIERRWRF